MDRSVDGGPVTTEPSGDEDRATSAAAPTRRVPPRWLAITAVLLAALIWSSSFAVTKVALGEVPPMTIGALRFAAAAVILGVIVRLRRGAALPGRRQRLFIGVAGLLGITAYFAIENVGVDLTTASDATLIVASYPIITLVWELMWGRASFFAVRLLGMLLAVGGVWLVVENGARSNVGAHRLLGDLILLAGGAVWAAYNLVAQRDTSGSSAVVVTYYQTLAGAAGFILLSQFESVSWSAISAGTWARIGFLAVFCSVVAFLLYNYGLTALPPSVAINLLNIVPVAGLFWAVILADENLSMAQVTGGTIVIIGVSLGIMRSTRAENPEP